MNARTMESIVHWIRASMSTLPSTGQILPPAIEPPPSPALLNQAFASFVDVAGSLEASYGQLQKELSRLRSELEVKNRELKRSLAQNESMREWLSRTLQVLPCGVLVTDCDLQLRLVNPEARRLLAIDQTDPLQGLGKAKEPASGRANGRDHGPRATALPEPLRAFLAGIIASGLGTERIWTLNGEAAEPQFVAVTCAVLPDPSARRGDVVFTLRNVTEQKRIDRERESAGRLRALGEMTTVLAHEIRNPLASLELFAGLISDATREQREVSQWCVHLQAGLRALSATVNNVLQFHSQSPLETVPTDVVKLLNETLQFLQPLALQRGMAIRLVTPQNADDRRWIRAEAHRLQQVFFNLAINAFRAMSSGGTLTVRVQRGILEGTDRCATIHFEDQGRGIAPENLDKIFKPGFTTTPGSPGLGLAVSKRVVEQHGGALRVRSRPNVGTNFVMVFPTCAPSNG